MQTLDPNDPLFRQKMQLAQATGQPYQLAQQSMAQGQNPYAAAMRAPSSPTSVANPQMSPDFSQMDDQALAGYASRDFKPQQRSLRNQEEMARALMMQKTPGVKQVGRVAATNIYEGLASGIEKGLGGYMLGKTREEQRELDAQRNLAEEARGVAGAREVEQERALKQALENERNRITQAEGAANRAAQAATTTASQEGQNLRSADSRQWLFPGESAPRTTVELGGINYQVNEDGTRGDPVKIPQGAQDLTGAAAAGVDTTEWLAKAREREAATIREEERAAAAAAEKEAQGAATAAEENIYAKVTMNPMVDVLRSGSLDAATGAADPRQWLGRLGYGPDGAATQATQRKINQIAVEGAADYLTRMKLTPVSNVDLALVQSPGVDKFTQPRGLVDYTLNNQMPVVSRAFDAGIEAGTHTPEQKQAEIDQLMAASVFRGLRSGMSKEELQQKANEYGVSPEIVEYEILKYEIEEDR